MVGTEKEVTQFRSGEVARYREGRERQAAVSGEAERAGGREGGRWLQLTGYELVAEGGWEKVSR